MYKILAVDNDLIEVIKQTIYDYLREWAEYDNELRRCASHVAEQERLLKELEQRVYRQEHTLDDVKLLCVQRGYHRKVNAVRGQIRKLSSQVENITDDEFLTIHARRIEELDNEVIKLCYEWADGDDVLANDMYRAIDLVNDAYYHRLGRLRNRIERMCNIGCCFLTLTFDDVQLGKHSPAIRRKRVQQFLNGFEVPYIANIDFGSENGREHYHAVICAPLEQLALERWKRGYVYYEEVGSNRVYRADKGIHERPRKRRDDTPEYDGSRTAKYMNKLTNHALKETTKGQKIMYCRNIDDKLSQMERDIWTQYQLDAYARSIDNQIKNKV